jgi:pyruvate,water dikinase
MRRFARLRDNGQSYMVKLLLPLRRLYITLGERFTQRDLLADALDICFLVKKEIEAAVAGRGTDEGGASLQKIADRRREAWKAWCVRVAPYAIDGGLRPVLSEEDADPNRLTGIPASRGTVTGKARVILSPGEASRLEPGDILVTKATDPGWTPIFSVIGGAVLEIGGTLSHGAIVAREYGIPAVVNVRRATGRIEDGQTITVDGTTGLVLLSSEGGDC